MIVTTSAACSKQGNRNVLFVVVLVLTAQGLYFNQKHLYSKDFIYISPVPLTEETSTLQIYHFPVEPLYNVQSIIEKRIGEVVLNDPVLNPFTHCSATVQYKLHIVSHIVGSYAPEKTVWLLQSMMLQSQGDSLDNTTADNHSGTDEPVVVSKTVGGDELYVEWISNTDMGVAAIIDQHDGAYRLEFTRPPAYQYNMTNNIKIVTIGQNGNDSPTDIRHDVNPDETFGQLFIHYHYTCGVAAYYALERQNFTGIGDVRESFTHSHIPRPSIQDFVPPNKDGAIDLSKYDLLIPFGDSVIREFYLQTFLKYTPSNCSRPTQYQHTGHALSKKSDLLDWLDLFKTTYGDVIDTWNGSIALITGSAVWDLLAFDDVYGGALRPDMMEHLNTVREYITAIRATYAGVDIYWKSPSALHLHRRDASLWTNPLNSYHTASILDVAQKKLMKELKVPYLDLYNAYYLSAAWVKTNDTMHYSESTLPSLLVSYFWPGLMNQFEYCNRTLVAPYLP